MLKDKHILDTAVEILGKSPRISTSVKSYLKEHSAENCASIYVLDGWFPRTKGGEIGELIGEAIVLVRQRSPEASILVYSNSMLAEDIARSQKVPYLDKVGSSMQDLMNHIERLLQRK